MSLTLSTDLAAALAVADKAKSDSSTTPTPSPTPSTPSTLTTGDTSAGDTSPFMATIPGPVDEDAEVIPSPKSVISDLFQATIKKAGA